MSLASHYGTGKFGLSFELYPPKTAQGEAAMYRHVQELYQRGPSYFTCTYGAGGSTRQKTLDVVGEVKSRFQLPVASHLTCVGSTVEQLRDYLTRAVEAGVDYIVALRGDPPAGTTQFEPPPGGLHYANELVALIKSDFPHLGVAVAGYPETHREAPSPEADLVNLRRKVDAGADIIITQLFYNNDDFFRFRDRCTALGIQVPIIPGILPVNNLSQIQRLSSMCGASLPADFVAKLSAGDDADWQYHVGQEFASRQVRELMQQGVPGLHFYVLNKSHSTLAVLQTIQQM